MDLKVFLLISVAILTLAVGCGGDGGKVRIDSSGGYVEGVGIQHPILIADHIAEGSLATYNSQPPTSGEHWPTPAQCGFYDEGLPDERVVHNMEHGNIVVSYNLPLESDVAALRDAISSIDLANVWGVTRAYEGIPTGQIGLNAWGVVDTFSGVDRDRIERFFEAYSGALGPELVPC